jgi:phytoene/squalene synthetase
VHPLTRGLLKTYYGDPGTAGSSGAAGERSAPWRELGVNAPAASPLAGILGFVDTAAWDLAAATFETRKELTAYCERWAAAMFQSAAAMSEAVIEGTGASGASNPSSATDSSVASNVSANKSGSSHWRRLGAAVREIELLSNLAGDARAGRLRVPVDELEQAGVDMKGLSKPPWPAALVNLLRGRHEALRAAITDSVSAFERQEQAHFRGLMVWAVLAWRQSQRTQRALPNVVLPRGYQALSDGWHAWRAARRAVGGNLRLS